MGLLYEILEGIYFFFLEPAKKTHSTKYEIISDKILNHNFWHNSNFK